MQHIILSLHSSDIGFKDFIKRYKDYTKEPYSFLLNDAIFSSDNPLRFRNNLLQKLVLVRKSKQLMTKSSKTKLNMIWTNKLPRFQHYHQEMLAKINF